MPGPSANRPPANVPKRSAPMIEPSGASGVRAAMIEMPMATRISGQSRDAYVTRSREMTLLDAKRDRSGGQEGQATRRATLVGVHAIQPSESSYAETRNT